MQVELRAAIALDHQPREVAGSGGIAAVRGRAGADLRDRRAEALAKHDVHDLLIGPIAIFERDLLGQDLDTADCLSGNVAELAEAGDALAIEQQHGSSGASSLRAPNLWRKRIEQLIDVRCACRSDIARIERV